MKENESKILNEFLSKTLKIDAEELASLYDEAGDLKTLQPAFDADAVRVKQHRTANSDQYNRGLKEAAEKLEKGIKSKYEFESELQGVELVDAIVLSKVEETKGASKDISKHPEFLKARDLWEKEQKKRDADWEAKFSEKDKEFVREKLLEKVRSKGLMLLDELKPILPGDPSKAAQWKQTFLNDLVSNNFQEADDDFLVLDKEGKPLQDAHGYGRKFKEFHKEIADKYFDYQKAEERSSAGNKDTQGTLPLPKNEDEIEKELRDPAITPKRRIELTNLLNGVK